MGRWVMSGRLVNSRRRRRRHSHRRYHSRCHRHSRRRRRDRRPPRPAPLPTVPVRAVGVSLEDRGEGAGDELAVLAGTQAGERGHLIAAAAGSKRRSDGREGVCGWGRCVLGGELRVGESFPGASARVRYGVPGGRCGTSRLRESNCVKAAASFKTDLGESNGVAMAHFEQRALGDLRGGEGGGRKGYRGDVSTSSRAPRPLGPRCAERAAQPPPGAVGPRTLSSFLACLRSHVVVHVMGPASALIVAAPVRRSGVIQNTANHQIRRRNFARRRGLCPTPNCGRVVVVDLPRTERQERRATS